MNRCSSGRGLECNGVDTIGKARLSGMAHFHIHRGPIQACTPPPEDHAERLAAARAAMQK